MKNFADRLSEKIKNLQSPIVMGLDPLLSYVPDTIREKYKGASMEPAFCAAQAIGEFNKMLIDAVAGVVPAIKPQLAYYEMYGIHGMEVFYETVAYAKEKGLIVIADAKRSDIGSTAAAYAAAFLGKTPLNFANTLNKDSLLPTDFDKETFFRAVDADAVTVNAYLGIDGVDPFLKICKEEGKGIFILVRTSNPSAGDFQDLRIEDGRPLYEHVAGKVREWGIDLRGECGCSSVGAVVGATWPEQAKSLREQMPHALILVPGYGTQGGDASTVSVNFHANGTGAVVNASRSLMCAYQKREDLDAMDFQKATYEEARKMKKAINEGIIRYWEKR